MFPCITLHQGACLAGGADRAAGTTVSSAVASALHRRNSIALAVKGSARCIEEDKALDGSPCPKEPGRAVLDDSLRPARCRRAEITGSIGGQFQMLTVKARTPLVEASASAAPASYRSMHDGDNAMYCAW